MPSVICSVINCSNGTYHLKKWKKEECEIHEKPHKDCVCEPPFHLFCFPSEKKNGGKRKDWVAKIKRATTDGKQWVPTLYDRVCSAHFVDGRPTDENPSPTFNLGYTQIEKKCRRVLTRPGIEVEDGSQGQSSDDEFFSTTLDSSTLCSSSLFDHSYASFNAKEECSECLTKQGTINSMSAEIKRLKEDNQRLRRVNKTLTLTRNKPFSCSSIKTDEKMNFYTGIASIAIFQALFSILKPYLSDINYWQGAKKMSIQSTRLRRNIKSSKLRKLSLQDEFLLTLMRLRLNLLNTHLADCFDISTGLCSQIFTTWIKILSKILGDALLV